MCIMIKKLVFFALALCLFSCGPETTKTMEYVKRSSPDKSYSIDIPASASQHKSISSFMSFMNEKDHLFITIQESDLTPNEFDDSQKQDLSFIRTTVENNDSVLIIKSTRGQMNSWSAYNCIGKTEVNGIGYIVTVGSDVWSLNTCREVLIHIMGSIETLH